MPLKIILVAGARPNFMKIAPIYHRMKQYPDQFNPVFVHTGQHYDDKMSHSFLRDLDMPEPDHYLNVGSASHAIQTAKIMIAFEKVVEQEKPDWVMVVGDVNSTIACALVASKLHIPVAHVEAGLRSYDREMPEEINRILTDQISDLLFTTCRDADENLKKEGIAEEKIHFVGNVMIESLIRFKDRYEQLDVYKGYGLSAKEYALVTLHRPSNVDDSEVFEGILKALFTISEKVPVLFPAHPRTQKRIHEFEFTNQFFEDHRFILTDPIPYFHFLALQKNAKLVLTDSGGVQEETTFFGVPCLTLRENTERPITVTEGTNQLIGINSESIRCNGLEILNNHNVSGSIPEFWDEDVSERICRALRGF